MSAERWGIKHPSGFIQTCPDRKAAEFAALFPLEPAGRPQVIVSDDGGPWKRLHRHAVDRALDGDHRICGTDPCSDCR